LVAGGHKIAIQLPYAVLMSHEMRVHASLLAVFRFAVIGNIAGVSPDRWPPQPLYMRYSALLLPYPVLRGLSSVSRIWLSPGIMLAEFNALL
jgi:hypothetical protein